MPEDSVKLEEFQKNKETLENVWDSFKYQLESQNVLSPEEITNRSSELRLHIDQVQKNLKEINQTGKYNNYANKLERRKNLTNYISDLKTNNGIDGNNYNESDFMEIEDPETENLRKNKIFWRNLGKMYNLNFERGINWEGKVETLKRNIEERERKIKEENEKRYDKPVEEDINKYQNTSYQAEVHEDDEEKLIENKFKDYHEDEEEEDYKYDVDEEPEQEIRINTYDDNDEEELDEEQERELERENRNIENQIREMEREKRRLEVIYLILNIQ